MNETNTTGGVAHTPGPWSIDTAMESERLHVIWSEPLCQESIGTLVARTCFTPASEANARLIAAAPTMYETLQKLDRYLGDTELYQYGVMRGGETPMEIVRAALALVKPEPANNQLVAPAAGGDEGRVGKP